MDGLLKGVSLIQKNKIKPKVTIGSLVQKNISNKKAKESMNNKKIKSEKKSNSSKNSSSNLTEISKNETTIHDPSTGLDWKVPDFMICPENTNKKVKESMNKKIKSEKKSNSSKNSPSNLTEFSKNETTIHAPSTGLDWKVPDFMTCPENTNEKVKESMNKKIKSEKKSNSSKDSSSKLTEFSKNEPTMHDPSTGLDWKVPNFITCTENTSEINSVSIKNKNRINKNQSNPK